MQLRVLGSAAGGGFPQWNCNCPNCDGFRRGTLQARARTQSSIAVSALVQATAWTRAEFEARLHAQGAGYHIHHPFNARMNSGQCPPEEIRHWIRNRFCHQICIPRKDAAILANMPGREHRRLWIERILDHDGYGDYTGSAAGGIEAWTRLGEAVGIPRDELWSLQGVAPAVRFACDAYVNFAASAPWQEAVCSSLTEMFAPQIHKDRLAGVANALSVDRCRGAGLLQEPHSAGGPGRGARAAGHVGALHHLPRAASGAGHFAVQARHPVDHARRHRKGLPQ